MLCKAHLLSYLEYRTAAVYHATRDVLKRLGGIQHRFLKDAGVGELDALFQFHLAPLNTRRDIAMLGLIYRTVVGVGPPHFRKFFQRAQLTGGERHRYQLVDFRARGSNTRLLARSAFGLIGVYNLLPDWVFNVKTVKCFQRNLQELVKQRATAGCADWPDSLSPRLPWATHPLQVVSTAP